MPDEEGLEHVEDTAPVVDPAAQSAELQALKEQNARLVAIAGDSDVAALLKAKEEKRQFSLRIGDPDATLAAAPVLPDDTTLEGMGNAELVKAVLAQVDTRMAAALESSPLAQGVAELVEEKKNARRSAIKSEAEGLVREFPDFAEYKDEVVTLAKAGVALGEANTVVRMRLKKDIRPRSVREAEEVAAAETVVERPTNTPLTAQMFPLRFQATSDDQDPSSPSGPIGGSGFSAQGSITSSAWCSADGFPPDDASAITMPCHCCAISGRKSVLK